LKANVPRQDIVSALRRARKYRHLCEDTLDRIAEWALERHPGSREALKAAKRKLHQIYGAYLEGTDHEQIDALVRDLDPNASDAQIRSTCEDVLGGHASTAERLGIMADLYPALLAEIGSPRRLLDLCCGLNPFSLPWMGLDPATSYRAIDIDQSLVSSINRFLEALGRPATAECRDVVTRGLSDESDAVLLLKSVPCLEQQEKGCATRILQGLRARQLVVSFPTGSLGGRARGMAQHYEGLANRMAEDLGTSIRSLTYPGETFFVLTRSH
jgi:16S rRNA (guanine(1405)-N(7))-methyltransferase